MSGERLLLLNWRFQQALYRAYYDAYQRSRLLYETTLETQAMDQLRQAKHIGPRLAMQRAEAILDRALTEPVAADYRARIHELAEALFQSVHMQLSVPRYQAIAVDRGASLDTIDVPLNDRLWLQERFAELRRLPSEAEQTSGLERIVNWTNPGPGGFYDDLGDLAAQPHLVRGLGFSQDPSFRHTALMGFTNRPSWRRSWCRHAESQFDAPLRMHYKHLDSRAQYRIRIVYAGDNYRPRIRLLANDQMEIHTWLRKPYPPRPLEFDVPQKATAKGELILSWSAEPGRGGNGRGCQVAEVWLIKKSKP